VNSSYVIHREISISLGHRLLLFGQFRRADNHCFTQKH
jgi:hypothetical protein